MHNCVVHPVKVNAVRWALEQSFGANCQLRAVPVASNIANQPIGFNAGRSGAMQRADQVEASTGEVRHACTSISYIHFTRHAWAMAIVRPCPLQRLQPHY